MSPVSKSKSKKDKTPTKAAKEVKGVSKLSGSASAGNESPISAYNPISGIFDSVDSAPTSSPLVHLDEQSGLLHGTAAEFDSLSNNGSCSGESEDHKEKLNSTASRQDTIPGSDNDKREKTRQKNERKHQRQKERRAQELHERCTGYLMSRKLEALSQKLVAMGFSSERATLALMLNEGKVEESVSWLFEGSEEDAQKKDFGNGANLKIDVSEELTRIAEMEVQYKCSKQEIERAVVACEGDLDRAEESLKAQKLEPPSAPPSQLESANSKHLMRPQENSTATVATQGIQNEREINYTNGVPTVLMLTDDASKNLQSSKANQSKSLAQRWPTTGTSLPFSYSMPSPVQVPSSPNVTVQHGGVGNEGRNFQQLALREPLFVMQRPQSRHIKQNPATSLSVSPPGTAGWYPNNVVGVDSMKLNGKLSRNQNTGSFDPESLRSQYYYPQPQSTRSLTPDIMSSQQYYSIPRYTQQTYMSSSVDPAANVSGSLWSSMGASSPTLTVPSSLGLFSGWGSTGTAGSSSQVDWNRRDMMSHCDYNSIDWSLESKLPSTKSNGWTMGKPSGMMLGLSSMRTGGKNGVSIAGFPDGGVPTQATSAGPREWTSPFAGKDIFSLPRQFVTYPSPMN